MQQLLRRWPIVLGSFALLSACEETKQVSPQEITGATACALDGMILADYPGPKAQMHYDQGPVDFFCDTVEMFSLYLHPEEKKKTLGLYVQDMGKTTWEKPQGQWIDAKSAHYVIGSNKMGAMGPTVASFGRVEDAQAFAKQHGGTVLRFEQITPEMVVTDGGVMNDERM